MELLIPSFLAGGLTILAPCVLALLPVILGGSVGEKNPWRPLVISLSLAVSVIAFTLLLKATTALLGIPQIFWKLLSGGLVLAFGITMVFPSLWDKISFKLKLHKSEEVLHKNTQKGGLKGAILLGASLGPVFTTCSPTYTLILAIVLPQNFFIGFINLLAYTLGLFLIMLLIGYGGQKVCAKFRGASNPNGWFKRSLGVLLIVTGLAVLTGYDKVIETKILDSGYLGPIELEQELLEKFKTD
jgi:cytochrome c-type biogenesis protein